MKDSILKIGDLKDVFDSDILLHVILSGDTAILVDGCPQGIVVNTGDGRTGGEATSRLELCSDRVSARTVVFDVNNDSGKSKKNLGSFIRFFYIAYIQTR